MPDIKTSVLILGQFAPRRLIDLAKLVEDCGYQVFWYTDERFFREPYAGLTLAATNTKQIKVGTCVTDPYTRHPALTAMAIGTLDEISEGRAILGVGAGISGFGPLGIKREKPIIAIREMVEVVQQLLSGEEVNYHGRLIHLDHGQLSFTPIRTRVPVYIASNGEHGLTLAGQIADGAIMQAAVADRTIQWMIENIARGARKAGRDLSTIDMVSRVNVCIADDSKAAKDVMRSGLARSLVATQPDFPTFKVAGLEVTSEIREKVKTMGYTHDVDRLAPVAAMIPDEYVDALTLAGSAEEVATGVRRMMRQGITHVIVYPVAADGHVEQTIEAFAKKVVPAVRRTL
ncbi:MAG: LLM class flavin-dependent oxidoreductase [Candidatus Tectomicrobia bacterium]|nr:LLM class flavin-dependent oxidoreductase [Candidatus Tectomicrobia bacterium]